MFRLITILLLFALVDPSQAETYEQLKSRATELLAQHQIDQARNVKVAWDERDKAAQAGDLWMQAAELGKNDLERFEAYDSAGRAYDLSSALRKSDVEAYRSARDIASAPAAERARVGLELAKRTRAKEDYHFVLGVAEATPQQRAAAYHALRTALAPEAKNDPRLYLQAVEYSWLEAAELAKFDRPKAASEIGMAMVVATRIPEQAQAIAQLERLHKTQLTLMAPDSGKVGLARVKLTLAERFLSVKAHEKALAVWKEVGRGDFPADSREEAWLKAAEVYRERKETEPALAALSEAAKHRAENFVFSEKIARQRIELLDAAKRPQEALAVLGQLIAHPKIPAAKKETLVLEQARRFYSLEKPDQAEKVLKVLETSEQADDNTLYEACRERVIYLIKKDLAEARRVVNHTKMVLAMNAHDEVYSRMALLSGEVYRVEKQYLKAFGEYQEASLAPDGLYRPSVQGVVALLQNFREAVKAGELEQARKILEGVSYKWVMHPVVVELMRARYAGATQDLPTARNLLASAKQRLLGLPQSDSAFLQKEIDEIEAGLK
ncbi:MAG: hypothetical protein WC423_01090 [Vulcanimicrobiota bacterium]